MKREEFGKLLLLVDELFCVRSRTAANREAFFLSLEPYSYRDAKDSVLQLSRESRYPPTPSEVARECEKLHPNAKEEGTDERMHPTPEYWTWYQKSEAMRKALEGGGA